MKTNEDILNELLTISPLLAGIDRKNVFTVPEGYFNTLNQHIINRTVHNQTLSSVPEGYFDNLAGQVLNKIKAEEDVTLETLAPHLQALQHINVFRVPNGYFNDLASVVLNKIQRPARVIEIQRRSIWKYAAAAIVTGFIAVNSLWTFNNTSQPVASKTFQKLGLPSYFSEAYQYKTEDELNEAIASLPSDDIVSYLQNTGTVADNEQLNSAIDTKNMPSQDDYLNDENTLETYLKQAENNN
jgi:hypothetical protein